MKMPWQEFDRFLESQRVHDGTLWLRILGESQDDYNEACVWVKVLNAEQASAALAHLQRELKKYYSKYNETKFTLSISVKVNDRVGYYVNSEGKEIFSASSQSQIERGPYMTAESRDIFDLR